ncbi:MAG: YfiR family protein [Verrucomicrobiia bacterium]
MALLSHAQEPPRDSPSSKAPECPGGGFQGLLLLLLALFTVWEAQAQVSREYDIKAVFLLNFAQFVEWPPQAFARTNSPFVIGVLGVADPFGRTLDEVVEGETVRGREIRAKRFRRLEEVDVCHILFLSASEERRAGEILAALKDRPILTVGDMDRFVSRGGMIKLYTEAGKVRLRINHEAARAAGLALSAKLLRVGRTSGEPD